MRAGSPITVGLLLVAVTLYVHEGIWPVVPQLANRPSDFENYYLAGRNLAAGQSPFAIARYDYPPILAFLLWPVAHLSYETARWIWFLISHGCILAAAFLTWKALGKDRLASLAVAFVWSCGGSLNENLALGQVNPMLVLLLALAIHGPSGIVSWALGAAAAIKFWPAALTPALLLARSRAPRSGSSRDESPQNGLSSNQSPHSEQPGRGPAPSQSYQRRTLLATLAIAALLIAGPFAVLIALFPPPYAPTHFGYWMGTPALLNFSLPASVLRLLDFPRSLALPHNWQFGNDVLELRLPSSHILASLFVALVAWVLGGALLGMPQYFKKERPLQEYAMAILVPLTLAALPLSWSHYQVLQLPGAALFLVLALRNRDYWQAIAVAALFLGTYQVPVILLRLYLDQYGWAAARPWLLWCITGISPVAALGLFALYLKASQPLRKSQPAIVTESACVRTSMVRL